MVASGRTPEHLHTFPEMHICGNWRTCYHQRRENVAKGAVRGGAQEKRFKSGEQWQALRREEEAVMVGKDGVEKQLPLDQARKFSLFDRQKITLSIGDRIRFTKNVKHRGQTLLNNELRTVVSIDEAKITFDKGEIFRKGAALHIDQGIAVTGHTSQAKTVDQVIVSVRCGRSAGRTKHNFTFRCRARSVRCMSLLIARLLCGMPSPGRASVFPLGSSSTWPSRTEF
jgi:hypothetical protein